MNTGLEYNLALRVRSATRWVEGQQGMLSDQGDGADNSAFGRTMLARTVTTDAPLGESVPSNYSGGSVALRGEIYEGNQSTGVVIWMQGVDGRKLLAGTLYMVRLSGTLTQSITYQGITTPTTRSLYLAIISPPTAADVHYRPYIVQMSEGQSKYIGEMKYYRITSTFGAGLIRLNFGGFLSSITMAPPQYGAPPQWGPVSPRLFLRPSGATFYWSSTEPLPLYDWYHVPQLVENAIVINRPGTALREPVANLYPEIRVIDPAPILVYNSSYTVKVSCTCMWALEEQPYWSYDKRLDTLWIVGKAPDIASSSTLGAPLGAPLGG